MPRRTTRPAVTTTEAPAEDTAPVTAAVTAAAPEVTEEAPKAETVTPEAAAEAAAEVAAAVTDATDAKEADVNPEVPETPTPTRAGTVEVRVLQAGFPFIDKDGNYQVLKQGETGKVTAAQADRGELLGAVERV